MQNEDKDKPDLVKDLEDLPDTDLENVSGGPAHPRPSPCYSACGTGGGGGGGGCGLCAEATFDPLMDNPGDVVHDPISGTQKGSPKDGPIVKK